MIALIVDYSAFQRVNIEIVHTIIVTSAEKKKFSIILMEKNYVLIV